MPRTANRPPARADPIITTLPSRSLTIRQPRPLRLLRPLLQRRPLRLLRSHQARSSLRRKKASLLSKKAHPSLRRKKPVQLLPLLRQLLLPQVRLLPPPAKFRSCGSRARPTTYPHTAPILTPEPAPARPGGPSNGSMQRRSRPGTVSCSRAALRSPMKH